MSIRRSLDAYHLLGRSGLRVSAFALGTMTFGSDWGWGADERESSRIFGSYLEHGGNFVDTSNQYTNGTSEELVGKFAAGRRDKLVIATKYTLSMDPDNPNAGGNHRKSMAYSLDRSLRRLRTDYIDLLYMHAWDGTTQVEEILRAMDDMVRSGKVLYLGVSNTMAWQVSRMQAITDLRGWSPLSALQIQYNLIERTAERELIPMAKEMSLSVVPWSPLAEGVLTGKYRRGGGVGATSGSAVDSDRQKVLIERGDLTERSLKIAEAVQRVALEIERTPSQVSLAWLLSKPGVASVIIGARSLAQLEENLGAIDVQLSDSHLGMLEKETSVDLGYPHSYLATLMNSSHMTGTMNIVRRS